MHFKNTKIIYKVLLGFSASCLLPVIAISSLNSCTNEFKIWTDKEKVVQYGKTINVLTNEKNVNFEARVHNTTIPALGEINLTPFQNYCTVTNECVRENGDKDVIIDIFATALDENGNPIKTISVSIVLKPKYDSFILRTQSSELQYDDSTIITCSGVGDRPVTFICTKEDGSELPDGVTTIAYNNYDEHKLTVVNKTDTSSYFNIKVKAIASSGREKSITITLIGRGQVSHLGYIYQREFSIAAAIIDKQTGQPYARVGDACCWGTGWLFDKPTTSTSDYEYYLATNLHVEIGFRAAKRVWEEKTTNDPTFADTYSFGYFCAFASTSDDGAKVEVDNMNLWDKFEYKDIYDATLNKNQMAAWNNGYLIEKCKWSPNSRDWYTALPGGSKPLVNVNVGSDLTIAAVSFSPNNNPLLKEKLELLNDYYDDNGYIAKFDENYSGLDDQLYLGGYSANFDSSPRTVSWSVGITNPADEYNYPPIDYVYTLMTEGQYGSGTIHVLNDNGVANVCVGNEILMRKDSCPNLRGGSSGSMVLTSDYKIAGIYWGIYHYPDFEVPTAEILCANNPNYWPFHDEMPYNFIEDFYNSLR